MNISTVVTVSLGLVIGSAIGLAGYSGVVDLSNLGISQREMAIGLDGEYQDGMVTPRDAVAESLSTAETNEAKNDASDLDEATLVNAENYLEKHPEDRKRAIVYGDLLVDKGQYERAIEFYEHRLKIQADDSEFWYGLGWAFEKSKNWTQAVSSYEQACERNNRHIAAFNNLAWVLATAPEESVRDGERAVKLAKRAMRMAGPKALFTADTLAAAFAENGDFKSATELQTLVLKNSVYKNQAELQQRLDLYEQGQAYRAK